MIKNATEPGERKERRRIKVCDFMVMGAQSLKRASEGVESRDLQAVVRAND